MTSDTSKKITITSVVTLICVITFTAIAYAVTQEISLPFDTRIQEAVFALRSHELTALLVLLTRSGNWQCVTLICAILVVIPKTRKQYGFPLACSALFSVAIYEILKYIFQRPRPDIALRLIGESGFSFPSGHSLTSLVVWGTLFLLVRSYARVPENDWNEYCDAPRFSSPVLSRFIMILLAVYIFLMGFSRIYVGVHYPTDVIASWCLGVCILSVIHSSLLPIVMPKKDK